MEQSSFIERGIVIEEMTKEHSFLFLQRLFSEERAMTIPFSMTKDHSIFILQRMFGEELSNDCSRFIERGMFGEEWTKEHSHFID